MKKQKLTLLTLAIIFLIVFFTCVPVQASQTEAVYEAAHPVVDTGQTTCFSDTNSITCPGQGDGYYGQDAQYTTQPAAYVDNGDGTITDTNTGLMWAQDFSEKMSWEEALNFADSLNLAGYDDWRLPTIKELYSLINFRGIDPAIDYAGDPDLLTPFIDTTFFNFAYGDTASGERIIDAQYWSSTEYVSTTMNNTPTVFGVNFADGRIKGYGIVMGGGESMEQYVRYVRGSTSYGINDYVDNDDNTITDHTTGLMWMQSDSGAGMVWEEALTYCETLTLAGYSDWRLPDAKELQSIVDYSRSPDTTQSAAIDPIFNVTQIIDEGGSPNYPYFWTSTTHESSGSKSGSAGVYIPFGEALGWMERPNGTYELMDVHGAGAQRSDPKSGSADAYPYGQGPQGDVVRIENFVRCVRTADSLPENEYNTFIPLLVYGSSEDTPIEETGFYLFAPLGETTTYLINDSGEVQKTWESTYRPGYAVYLLENGSILRTGNTQSTSFNAGGAGGIVEKIDPNGSVTWSFTYDSTDSRLHHDIEALPNGNILMIAWEKKTEAEALAAGRDPDLLNDGELWPDKVIEVDPTTNAIVWEWHLWDHLVQDQDSGKANFGSVVDYPELVDLNYCGAGARPGDADWTHINAIDYNAELDQILLSVRNFSEIWIIDHSTTTAEAAGHSGGEAGMGGDLLYRWGNPQAYDSGDSNDQQLFVQHDAQWIEADLPGGGNILIFNNGDERSGRGYSSVDEIVPPLTEGGIYSQPAPGTDALPTSPTWSYTADPEESFFAANISGTQRLPNGSTLICDGPAGVLFEVTDTGKTVWAHESNGPVFDAYYYNESYAGIQILQQETMTSINQEG